MSPLSVLYKALSARGTGGRRAKRGMTQRETRKRKGREKTE